MRLCCRKATETTITTPWLIDFYCYGNSPHCSSLQHSHHFLLLRAIPSTPVQLHPGWQSVRQSQLNLDSQWFACLQVAGSVSRWSFTAALAQAAPGRLLTGRLMYLCGTTPAAQQLINSKQLHQEISALTNCLPCSTRTSAQRFQNTDFSQFDDRLLERFFLSMGTGKLAMNLLLSFGLKPSVSLKKHKPGYHKQS